MFGLFLHIPFEPLMNRIIRFMRISLRPVRDGIWVETRKRPNPHRAVRSKIPILSGYGICRNLVVAINHMAYQPVGGHGLRHATSCLHSVFYRYVVPPGQAPSAKSFNP